MDYCKGCESKSNNIENLHKTHEDIDILNKMTIFSILNHFFFA